MIMAERRAEVMSNGAERPAVGSIQEPEPSAINKPPTANPWYRRVLFWRAVAGMAVAIALGCAVVAIETASELSSSSSNYHRRLSLLGSRVSRMRTQIANAERQLSAMRADRTARANMNRILSAPDAMLLRLTPHPGPATPRGLVAISKKAGRAMLEVAGLLAAADRRYVMWWLAMQGEPAKAAQFEPGADERVSVMAEMPPPGTRIVGVMITLEADKSPDKPAGAIMLKGELPKPRPLS
jgi:hypothetical protein